MKNAHERNRLWKIGAPAGSLVGMLLLFFLVFSVQAQEPKDVSDPDITMAVERELLLDEGVPAHKIDSKTEEGIVMLSGSVNHILAKDRAANIAGTIKGVRSVVNRIEVDPPEKSDEQLKNDVKDRLLYDPATDSYEVMVHVSDGEVTLTGTVNSWAEKQLCTQVAKGVKGVRELKNQIAVDYKTDRSDWEIRNEVEKKLQNSVWVDGALIEVSVKDGKVMLDGTVGSADEKRRARGLVWVAGVSDVDISGLEVQWWARDHMRRESKYAMKDDKAVKQAVKDAMLYDPRVFSFNPQVSVTNGVVTLTGEVDNLKARKAAEQDALNTIGVVQVKNYLKVRPAKVYSDETISASVKDALLMDPLVDLYEINVTTINGSVYLTGRVNTELEKRQAEDVASRQPGVIEVENNIITDYTWEQKSDKAIEQDIKNEFFWSLVVEGDQVNVDVENGIATLTGEVSTKHEARAAVKNAFEGGARTVYNQLDVKYDYGWPVKGYYEWPYYDNIMWPYPW